MTEVHTRIGLCANRKQFTPVGIQSVHDNGPH